MDEENNLEGREKYLNKKERAKEKRAEKEAVRNQERSARKFKKLGIWALVIIVIGGLIYWGVVAADKANESRPGERFPSQGREHINIGDEHEEYTTNPPTSGPHADPVDFGVYDEELLDENLIHNIEHGGIWISYTGISDEEIAQLEEIARRHPGSVVLAPRSANDAPIAVASWERLMKLDTVDEEAIEEYIRSNINKSPEPLAF